MLTFLSLAVLSLCIITEKWVIADGKATLTLKMNPSQDLFESKIYTNASTRDGNYELKYPLSITLGSLETNLSYNIRSTYSVSELEEHFVDDPFCDLAGTSECGSKVSLCCLDNHGERLNGLYCPIETGRTMKFYSPRTFSPKADFKIVVEKNGQTYSISMSLDNTVYEGNDIVVSVINNEDLLTEYWNSISFLSWGILNEPKCLVNETYTSLETKNVIFGGDEQDKIKWVTKVSCSIKESQLNEVNWDSMSTLSDITNVDSAVLACVEGTDKQLSLTREVEGVVVDLSLIVGGVELVETE